MADYWIKLYLEILDDPKMALLPDRLWRRTVEMFLLAGRLCLDKSGVLPDTRQLAWLLRMTTDELQLDLDQLAATTGIVEPIPGGWRVVNFKKRQDAASSTERVRQHRERKHRQQYYGNETDLKRNVAQINRLTETETEPELSVLSETFTNKAKILPYDLDRWTEAEQQLTRAGVTPEELVQALDILNENGMTVAGLWSVVKQAIWVHSQHAQGRPIRKPKAAAPARAQTQPDFMDLAMEESHDGGL